MARRVYFHTTWLKVVEVEKGVPTSFNRLRYDFFFKCD